MVAVGGLLASAVVKMAGDKLGSAIAQQASLVWNVRQHMEDMKNTLETIKAVLKDAERRSIREELVRLWLKRLKNAAYDISHMLDKFQEMSTQQQMTGIIPIAIRKISQGNKMKKMREKLRKIDAEHTSFNFMQNTITIHDQQSYDSRETASEDVKESDIIGRDADKLALVDLLSSCRDTEQATILPIYGLGGIGKSTLAGLVYRDTQFKGYDHRVWVYVSQVFDLIRIGNSIIFQLSTQSKQNTNSRELTSRELISQCLDDLLCGKKVLVVLDDLWEDKESELNKLKTMVHRRNQSTIDVIVTTRREDIASKVCTDNCKPYELKPLENDICWGIIKRCSQFENKANKGRLQPIGMSIAEKCGGVALAAQALGRTLKKIEDIHGWSEIDNSDMWTNENPLGTEVLPSLQLSYERMVPTLRLCFSYCAIFPKGHDIVEDDLIHQWAAMDFVEQPPKGKEYIKELLGMSFLQHSKLPSVSTEHMVRYTMHDLVHDLARSVISDELIVTGANKKSNTGEQKYCWCASLKNYDGQIKLSNILPKRVRALQFSNSSKQDIPGASFSFAKYLRVLDFSDCRNLLLPASIGQMKQLRCLIAPRMKNKVLPESIVTLPKLQYINLHGSSQLSALPEKIGELGFLRYLGLSDCSRITKLPESFGDLKSMVHLDMSDCHRIRELPSTLGNLTNLQHLNLSYCLYLGGLPETICRLVNLEYLNMSDCKKIRELPESFSKLTKLLHLDMKNCHIQKGLPGALCGLTALQQLVMSNFDDQDSENDGKYGDDISGALGNLTNLQYLNLASSICKLFGSDTSDRCVDFMVNLTNLEHLDLSHNYTNPSYLPENIGDLKKLRTLDLTWTKGLKSLPESIRAITGLKSLLLEGCSEELMDQVAESGLHYSLALPLFKVHADDGSGCSNLHLLKDVNMSELRILSLEKVSSLEEAHDIELRDKQCLSDLELHWTSGADRLLVDKDLTERLVPPRQLKYFLLRGYSGSVLPSWFQGISDHLPNLVSITLRDLPECCSLPPLGQLPNLQILFLQDLPCITEIGKDLCGGKGAFPRLSTFSLLFMEGLEEWNTTYSGEDGAEVFLFPELDKLSIAYCPVLKLKPCPPTFGEWEIINSDQVISALEEMDNTSHLSSSDRSTKLVVFDGDSQSMTMLRHFPALQELTLGHCSELKSLPESLRNLSSLQKLHLRNCDKISALPEWLGDLSSLTSLTITGCYVIESLPPCIQQLTKLRKLHIDSNSKLKKWCESEENKMKLAHIRDIVYDSDRGGWDSE